MSEQPCPKCGHCPTCGRGPVQVYPYQWWYPVAPQWWQQPIISCGTSPGGPEATTTMAIGSAN